MQAQYISRFTPRSMSPETLEAIFVQRKRFKLAERLIELIRESTQTENKHYRLLVGNRGIGKTHLISLIYHRLMKIEELREHLLIAWLPEEAYQIDSFLGFLMTVFEALKEEYPEEYEAELQEKVEGLCQLSCGEQEHQAKELLRKFVGEKTLLLLIENLDMVFEGLEETGQHQLRAYLYNYKFCTILATSQSLFKEVKIKDYPFYGSFQFHHLEELSSDEAVDLLANIAQLNEDKELETFLQSLTGQERVKAVHHLAGGNPRIYVVFSGFLSRESLDELVPAFMKMLDELTPYYQERMLALTARQRKIVNFLCDRRYACLLDDIAQRCFLDTQSAKEELRELRMKGYVRMEEIARERFYELREPLLRFCLQVKKQKNKPISLFVDFLRLWYSREELEARLSARIELKERSKFSLQSKDLQVIGNRYEQKQFLEKDYLFHALQEVKKEIDPRVIAYQKQYDIHYDKEEFSDALQYAEKLIQIRGQTDDFCELGYCLYQLKQYKKSLLIYEKVIKIDENNIVSFFMQGHILNYLKQYEAAFVLSKKAIAVNPSNFTAWTIIGETFHEKKQYKDALNSYEKAINIYPFFSRTWAEKGKTLNILKRYEESLNSYEKAIEIDPKYAFAWAGRGETLSHFKRYEESLNSYEKAIEIDSKYTFAWAGRGETLSHLKRYEESLNSYEKAIEIDSKYTFAWAGRGETLSHLKRYEESLNSYEKAIEIDPKYTFAWAGRGENLYHLKRYEESLNSYEKAIEIESKSILSWFCKGWILNILEQYDEAVESYQKIIELGYKHSSVFFNLAVALLGLNSWREGIQSLNQAFDRIESRNDIYSEDAQLIIRTIFKNYQNEDIWRTRINTLIEIYDKHQALSIFAQGLTSSIPMLISSTFDRERVQLWLEIWQELTADCPEFELPLRLLAKEIEYKEKNRDPRVLLTLPIEERAILKQLLEDASNDHHSVSLNDI